MTDIEVIITQPVIEIKFESTLNSGGGGAVDSVNGETGDVVLTTTDINEGTNQYFTEARVRATVLTGLSLATNAVIAATDSILVAFGKLQAQLTALSSSLANYVTLATDQTITALKTFSNGFTLTPQAVPTYARGRVYFDDTNDCLAFMDSISGRSVQVGYEVLMLARNNTGVQINNGQVVYINGSTGTNSTVALAQANAEATSMIIGVATHNISINTVGKIVVFGLANDLDTSAFTDGQEVFLSAATAGALTATPPASPNYVVRVGIVERAHPTQGKILVKPEITTANNNSLGTSQRLAPTQNAVKTYVDGLSYLKEKTLDFFVGTSTTTNQAETILRTIPITANDVANLDALWSSQQISTSQASGTMNTRVRVGTSAVPANITLETLIFEGNITALTGGYNPIHNYMTFDAGNIIATVNPTMTRAAGFQLLSSTSPPLNATWYIYITSQKAIAGGTVSLFSSIIKRDRA